MSLHQSRPNSQSNSEKLRENGMELFAAFAGLAPARGGQAVALVWKGLRPDAGCSMRFTRETQWCSLRKKKGSPAVDLNFLSLHTDEADGKLRAARPHRGLFHRRNWIGLLL